MTLSRRSLLAGSGAAIGGLAGCLDSPFGDGDLEEGYAAFFALADWTRAIAGDELEVADPIGVGEAGHGWTPGGGLTADVAETDFFVYIDTPEFAWAQDLADGLVDDYDHVTVIDAFDGLEDELLAWDGGHDHDHEYDGDPATADIHDVILSDYGSGDTLADYHEDHWHGDLGEVEVGSSRSIGVTATTADGDTVPLGTALTVTAESTDPDTVTVESRGDHLRLHGEATGMASVDLALETDEGPSWEAAERLRVTVVDDRETDGASEFHDPHAWVDPVLAGDMVQTIADELADADPDNADTYHSNAEDYREELATVDDEFSDLVAAADRSAVVFAGHDSFQYIEHRYGLEFYTPVGVSPDAAESFSDVADLVDVVDQIGTDTILYDPFETPNPDEEVPDMVSLLLEHSDASDMAPLTPIEGTTATWADNDWGWVEQMHEINIPSLAKALGVDR